MRRIAITLSVLFQVFVLSHVSALAASPASAILGGVDAAGALPGYKGTNTDISLIVGKIIQALLGLTGIIFMIILVYGGIIYMTAAGDPGKVDKAKKMMTQAVIGLIIIVGAYSISTFVITQLSGAV